VPKALTSHPLTIVALGFFALALVFSTRASLGLAMPIWESQFGWTRDFVSNVGAIALIVMAIIVPLLGSLLDCRGLGLHCSLI
jgi:MFS-type transporter involved in bile tolerance (Atg22 family)